MTLTLICLFGLGMAAFLGCAVYFYGQGVAARNSALLLSRLANSDGGGGGGDLQFLELDPKRLAKSPALQKFLQDFPFIQSLAQLLVKSGRKTTVAQMLSIMCACASSIAIVAFFLGCNGAASIFLGLVVGSFPTFYYAHLGVKRATAFEAQLPQVMEMLSLYLRSGRSLPQAFMATAEEIPVPASEEFAVCAEEYRLGKPLDVAFKSLAIKYPGLLGVRLFATAISVLGQAGGNLVEVLERIKNTLDASLSYALKLRSMTGEARTSAYILGATPGFFMAATGLLNPEYFNSFFNNSFGLFLFGMFCFFWGSGILWVRALMQTKV